MITRTLSRIALGFSSWFGGTWIRAMMKGIAGELARVSEMRDSVYCAVVPSTNLCTGAIFDLEGKYGIDHNDELTDEQRIARILDRASMNGAGGPKWLENVIQSAGFPLYVVENVKGVSTETQFGDIQFDQTTQFATMPSRVDPSSVSGVLITSSANKRGGRAVAPSSQFGSAQFGSSRFGTPDTTKSYPQPATRNLPTDPTTWGRVFFLSPIKGRLASRDELLIISEEEQRYLIRLIEQVKFLRNWCVLQVGQNVQRSTDDGSVRVLEDGTTIRRI